MSVGLSALPATTVASVDAARRRKANKVRQTTKPTALSEIAEVADSGDGSADRSGGVGGDGDGDGDDDDDSGRNKQSEVDEAIIRAFEAQEAIESFDGLNTTDPSMVLSMERTLFSSLNMAMIVMMGGVGLMSVGQVGDTIPDNIGIFLISGSIAYVAASWAVHVWRMDRLSKGRGLAKHDSVLWTGSLVLLLIIAVVCELHFGVKYPFLERSKAVTIETPAEASA